MPPDTSPFSVVEDGPFLAALNTAILFKRHVRDVLGDLHRLNKFERIFICVDTFLTEAQAGGVGHFFENDCAVLYDQVLLGFTEIGAQRLRLQVEHYVAHVFGRELPSSAESRRKVLHALSVDDDNEAERIVDALDSGTSLLAGWARAHEQHFALQ
jgi:Domain of unknown function (DUF4375)